MNDDYSRYKKEVLENIVSMIICIAVVFFFLCERKVNAE